MLGASCAVYFDIDGGERVSGEIPRGGINCAGLLRLCRVFPANNELRVRLELLRAYVDRTGSDHFLLGDLSKGGRRAGGG